MRDHLGYYVVNGIQYRNKTMALLACRNGQWPEYYFNDDVFSMHDWTIEPSDTLTEIYKKRALQIREKYEKVILLFSGGIDSVTVLRSFVDNDIPIDGIVSYGAFSANNPESLLRNAEIYNCAIPYIKKLEKKTGKKLPYHLIDDWPMMQKMSDESWLFSTNGSSLSPETYAYNFHTHDSFVQDIMSQGRTVLLRGIDKPRVMYDGRWHIRFLDCQTGGFHTSGLMTDETNWYDVDYFFWTRDMPELLIKQGHVIKNWFESYFAQNPQMVGLRDALFAAPGCHNPKSTFKNENYYTWIDPLIYGDYLSDLPGQEKSYFSVGKSSHVNSMIKDHVFFDYAPEAVKKVWDHGIDFARSAIDPMYLNGFDGNNEVDRNTFIEKGYVGQWTRPYYLT
jgi:hypothetical protein